VKILEPLAGQLKSFFDIYGAALEKFDARAASGFYGFPCFMISDNFAGALSSPDELTTGLSQAYEFYKQFDLAKVTYEFTKIEVVSEKLVRVRITWKFYDSKGTFLTDSDYVYLLRKENDSFKVYVVIPLDEEQKMQELIQKKNVPV